MYIAIIVTIGLSSGRIRTCPKPCVFHVHQVAPVSSQSYTAIIVRAGCICIYIQSGFQREYSLLRVIFNLIVIYNDKF